MNTTAPSPLLRNLAILRRRARPAAAVALGVLAIALLLALLLPPVFRSQATILIEQQEIPQDLVRSTITTYADQRVQVISQRVMTTQNLLGIIQRFDLYPGRREREPREQLIARMRDDIDMQLVSADVIDPRSGRPSKATIAFTLAYENRSPDLAARVANELVTLYLNENLVTRTQLARETTTFLQTEGDRLSGEIAALERQLATFKERHVDNLPELAALNLQLTDRAEFELRDAEARLRSLADQRTYLEVQLAQLRPNSAVFAETGERILGAEDRLKALRSQLAAFTGRYGEDHPDVHRTRREIAGLEREVASVDGTADLARRLEQARAELATARERYAEDHPDVVALARTVSGIESAIAASPPAAAALRARAAPDNPAYVQVRTQLEAIRNEIRAAEDRRAKVRAQLGDYERRQAAAPEVEREYRGLVRDYEAAQLKYREVRAKLYEAEVSRNLETDQKGERFTMIEPPLVPQDPVSPNRLLLLIVGLALAVAAGIGTAATLESLDRSVRGRDDLIDLLDVPPLAVVPLIVTADELQARARQRVYAAVGAGVAMVAVLASVHVMVRPLDLLWFAMLRRFGG